MSLEKITKEIMDEAEGVKNDLLLEAKSEAEKILKEARTKADEMIKAAEKSGQDEKDKIIERRRIIVNVDMRKLLLEKKQEILHEAFEEAGVDYEENKRELSTEVAKVLF